MKFNSIITLFLLLTCSSNVVFSQNNENKKNLHKLFEAKKHKEKEKNKAPTQLPIRPKPTPQINFNDQLNTISLNYKATFDEAIKMESSVTRTFSNIDEVVNSLNQAAILYASASQIIQNASLIIHHFSNSQELTSQIQKIVSDCEIKAAQCNQEALGWSAKVLEKKTACYAEIERLKIEAVQLEQQENWYSYKESYKQIASIQQKMIELGEANEDSLSFSIKKFLSLKQLTIQKNLPQALQN